MSEEEKNMIDNNLEKNNITTEREDVFIGFGENGEKKTFYKLLEFDSEETGKHYLAYTDNETNESGNINAYGAVVIQDGNYMKLEPITTEKEWKVIETALRVLQDEIKGNSNANKEE